MTLLSVATFGFTSCGEDPKLVSQRDKQDAEIQQLTGDLAAASEQVRKIPVDVTRQLTAARKKSEEYLAKIAALEAEWAIQEADQTTQQQMFEAYKVKYPLK